MGMPALSALLSLFSENKPASVITTLQHPAWSCLVEGPRKRKGSEALWTHTAGPVWTKVSAQGQARASGVSVTLVQMRNLTASEP